MRAGPSHGLSRRPTDEAGIQPVAADLQDAAATATALADIRPDAVFITTWLRQDSEAENIRVNAGDGTQPAGRATPRRPPPARRAGDGSETLSRPVRILWQGHAAADAVPRGAGAAGRREFLLRAGGRAVRRRRARRLFLERPPAAYGDRHGRRQRDEHGHDAGRLRNDMPRDRPDRFAFRGRPRSGAG